MFPQVEEVSDTFAKFGAPPSFVTGVRHQLAR
jgi:hypothetical protein